MNDNAEENGPKGCMCKSSSDATCFLLCCGFLQRLLDPVGFEPRIDGAHVGSNAAYHYQSRHCEPMHALN